MSRALAQRLGRLLSSTLAAALAAALSPSDGLSARELGCRGISGIAEPIALFLRHIADAQAAGAGTMTIKDVLIGVTAIPEGDERALAMRGPVKLSRKDAKAGDFTNDGPQAIQVQGLFAATLTFFNIPRSVRGQYRMADKSSAVISYNPQFTLQLGERVLGIPFFRTLDHTVVSAEQLSFYFQGNTTAVPDRCYSVLRD